MILETESVKNLAKNQPAFQDSVQYTNFTTPFVAVDDKISLTECAQTYSGCK